MKYDFCVIGAGIVGCATALKILEDYPGSSLLLLEKEAGPAQHQTGHNSGVVHAGIYYTPGSLKAKLCRSGLIQTKEFCEEHNIPYEECGKLIVATNSLELSRIEVLYNRATENVIRLEKLNQKELKEKEPNIFGVGALYSPETAIVDYKLICKKLINVVEKLSGDIHYNVEIKSIKENIDCVEIVTNQELFTASQIVVCGGVQSDRLAKLAGIKIDFKIIPFRGEYYKLVDNKSSIVNHLIYPAPDPDLPFLGIHLTRMIDGSVTVGPNAVIGFSREGYSPHSFSLNDSLDFILYKGMWRLVSRYRAHAFHELLGSLSKKSYLKDCQKYCPSLELSDLLPFRAGIRAQLVNHSGELVHDFVFKKTERMLHVCNAPSPAATSALSIGAMISKMTIN